MIVDASVWVSVLVAQDANHATSRQWLDERLKARDILVVPTLFLSEVAGAIARRTGVAALGHQAVQEILHTPRLRLIALERDLGAEAARIAADLHLRGTDAVYVAAACALSLPLATWDQELQDRASRLVEVLHP
ncbi:MAG: PIN domain-containing protein [Chloroflexota bacterium]|nr:MAG: PIN domain-containing protein [Chloroflexota bacterium]